jgi:hypothetical protein
MESEALRKIRTLRQAKTSMDVARKKRVRTTNSLSKTKQELEHLEALTDPQEEERVLARERGRFASFEKSIEKSRHNILNSREKLAKIVNKNRALTELRHDLQKAYWEKQPEARHPNNPGRRLPRMGLEY